MLQAVLIRHAYGEIKPTYRRRPACMMPRRSLHCAAPLAKIIGHALILIVHGVIPVLCRIYGKRPERRGVTPNLPRFADISPMAGMR
jgi:hypothetical protein